MKKAAMHEMRESPMMARREMDTMMARKSPRSTKRVEARKSPRR